jgi:hypothetical protein
MRHILSAFAATTMLVVTCIGSQAETAVERQCATGKCTCSYIAGTCRKWNAERGADQSRCEQFRQSCLASGEYHDPHRNITKVIRR